MADTKLSALSVATLTEAAEMYLNASGSKKSTIESLRNFFLGAAAREVVVAASTGNGTLATAYENGDTLDGVTLATDDRILLKDQTAGEENGIYTVEATGAPTRATDFDTDAEAILGAIVAVALGTTNAETLWMHTTTAAITLDTTTLTFAQVSGGGGGASAFLDLTDVDPSTYSGQASKAVTVNSGEDGLEFTTAGSSSGVGLPFSGALVNLSGDQTITTSTATALSWGAETYDVGGWWVIGSPTRMTVPAGVTRVRLTVNNNWAVFTNQTQIWLEKNGSEFDGGGIVRQDLDDVLSNNVASAIVDVVPGDYFEAVVFHVEGVNADILANSARTWFSIEAVETVAPSVTPRGALVKLAADETGANYTAAVHIPFDGEVYDTDDIHDNSTNNSRLTVPSGVTHVRLTYGVKLDVHTSGEYARVRLSKNGSDFFGAAPQAIEVTNTFVWLTGTSPILEVVGGDYFEVLLKTEADTSVTVQAANTSFAMEIVGPAVVTAGGGGGTEVTVQTTDATKTNIATGAVASGEVATLDASGQAIETATGDVYWFTISGAVKNISGTTTLVGTPLITSDGDAGAATWTVGLEADDAGDNWELTVTGEAAHTIEWKLSYVEVLQ